MTIFQALREHHDKQRTLLDRLVAAHDGSAAGLRGVARTPQPGLDADYPRKPDEQYRSQMRAQK